MEVEKSRVIDLKDFSYLPILNSSNSLYLEDGKIITLILHYDENYDYKISIVKVDINDNYEIEELVYDESILNIVTDYSKIELVLESDNSLYLKCKTLENDYLLLIRNNVIELIEENNLDKEIIINKCLAFSSKILCHYEKEELNYFASISMDDFNEDEYLLLVDNQNIIYSYHQVESKVKLYEINSNLELVLIREIPLELGQFQSLSYYYIASNKKLYLVKDNVQYIVIDLSSDEEVITKVNIKSSLDFLLTFSSSGIRYELFEEQSKLYLEINHEIKQELLLKNNEYLQEFKYIDIVDYFTSNEVLCLIVYLDSSYYYLHYDITEKILVLDNYYEHLKVGNYDSLDSNIYLANISFKEKQKLEVSIISKSRNDLKVFDLPFEVGQILRFDVNKDIDKVEINIYVKEVEGQLIILKGYLQEDSNFITLLSLDKAHYLFTHETLYYFLNLESYNIDIYSLEDLEFVFLKSIKIDSNTLVNLLKLNQENNILDYDIEFPFEEISFAIDDLGNIITHGKSNKSLTLLYGETLLNYHNLDYLLVNDKSITLEEEQDTYNLVVDSNVDFVNIEAISNFFDVLVEGNGKYSIKEKDNIIEIKTTSLNGLTKIYKLNIWRLPSVIYPPIGTPSTSSSSSPSSSFSSSSSSSFTSAYSISSSSSVITSSSNSSSYSSSSNSSSSSVVETPISQNDGENNEIIITRSYIEFFGFVLILASVLILKALSEKKKEKGKNNK